MRLACLLLSVTCAFADDPVAGNLRIDSRIDLKATGDAAWHVVYRFHSKDYATKKADVPDPKSFMWGMHTQRCDYEVADASCRYDDASTSVIMDYTKVGAAKNAGEGKWELPVDPGPDFINMKEENGRCTLYFYEAKNEQGSLPSKGQVLFLCPPGAKDVTFNPADHVIQYALDCPENGKAGKVKVDLRAKARLMTCIYKVYGLGTDFSAMWVAKSLVKNTGEGKVKDLRVRYRLEGYSEWSMWQKAPELVPGQTFVSVWYPVLDRTIAALRTTTPANLDLEWKYDDGTGKERDDNEGKRIVLLGVNEFVFSNTVAGEAAANWQDSVNNAPFIAAWVSRDDPVIKQFAAMANKNAGGVGAGDGDEDAIRVLRACYELMLANDFTYQHPPTLADKSVSFDPQTVQNVKFPRDVVRDKSGTCIDLAICYAAMAHAIGLHPHLALIPGHCFPVVDLPSGKVLVVETTGVQGGVRFGSANFDKVVEYGKKEYDDAQKDGRVILIDVPDYWTRGVSNPELEALPPDILDKWKVVAGSPQGADAPPAAGGNVAIDGSWAGQFTVKGQDGTEQHVPVTFLIETQGGGKYRVSMRYTNEGAERLQVDEVFDAEVKDNALALTGTKCVQTNLATGATEDVSLDNGTLRLQNGQLVGKVGNDTEGWVDVALDRQP